MPGKLQVERFTSSLNDANMYLMTALPGRGSILIDPSDADKAAAYLQEHRLKLDYILLTHEHYDHICALNELRSRFYAPVVASKPCSDRIQNPGKNLSKVFNLVLAFKTERRATAEADIYIEPYQAEAADVTFQDKAILNWREHEIQIQEAPGHSKGSVLIELDGQYLFSGDTLSLDYELVTRFPGGSKKEYQNRTLPLLMDMKSDMTVYPGHGRSFKINEVSLDFGLSGRG